MGSIYKKGDTWYIRYDAPPDPKGKRKQIAKACTGMTKRQAEQLLRETETAIVRGEYQTPVNMTMGAFLDEWLSHAWSGLAISTAAMYEQTIRTHMKPELGQLKLDQLTPLHLQRFYAKLQQAGSNHNKQSSPLSPKTVQNIHRILHRALVLAVKWGLRTTNPADAVELPRQIRPQIAVATGEDMAKLMAAIEDAGEWRIPLLIAIGTGMRRGEILALQWQDYDPTKRILIIQRALAHVTNHGGIIVKGTKTDRVRVVKINDSLAAILDQHRAQTTYDKPADWICVRADGSHMIPHSMSNYFTALSIRLKLHGLTLHGLRHTHATDLIAAGIPVKVVSERLGHATVAMTQDKYTHVLPTMQQQAADITEQHWQQRMSTTE